MEALGLGGARASAVTELGDHRGGARASAASEFGDHRGGARASTASELGEQRGDGRACFAFELGDLRGDRRAGRSIERGEHLRSGILEKLLYVIGLVCKVGIHISEPYVKIGRWWRMEI